MPLLLDGCAGSTASSPKFSAQSAVQGGLHCCPSLCTVLSAVRGSLTLPAEHQVCSLETCAGASNCLPSMRSEAHFMQMLSEAQKQFGEARRWVEQGAKLLASTQRKVRQHHAGKQCPYDDT